MKLKALFFAGAGLMMLAGCGNSPKSIDEVKPETPSDSLSYFIGQLYGQQLVDQAERDSVTFGSEQARKDYIEGYMKGMGLLKDGNDAYNAGLMAGVQMAQAAKEFTQQYESFKFNHDVFEQGMRFAAKDTQVDQEASKKVMEFVQNITKNFADEQEAKDNAKMAEYAKKEGYKELKDGLFFKSLKPGSGFNFAEGDSISFSVSLKGTSGKDLSQYAQKDNVVVLGKTLPTSYPYYDAILAMKPGETACVLMNPKTIFGPQAARMGLDDKEYIVLTIDAKLLSQPNVAPVTAK